MTLNRGLMDPVAVKCPICLDIISAAYATACGHSFCHECIIRHLRFYRTCPTCSITVSESDLLPNHALERLVKRLKRSSNSDEEDPPYGLEGDSSEDRRDEQYESFLHSLLHSKQNEVESLQKTISALKNELEKDVLLSSVPKIIGYESGIQREEELGSLYETCLREKRDFKRLYHKLTAPYSLKVLNSALFGDVFSQSNVVSSVEYNSHRRLFAVSGSAKQIRIYEYDTFSRPIPSFAGTRFSFPVLQLSTTCKVAAVAWDPSNTSNLLAAADYEGSIKFFDVSTGSLSCQLDEHERRVWSIDFSKTDSNTLLSGSDDGRVKHWAINDRSSSFTLDIKANVCSVQFHQDGLLFAFGSADHSIYVHDIRSPYKALHSLLTHKKAVSYVRWLDRNTLLTASTDNTIKQWRGQECIRTHRGHLHEKNFVGLATHNDWFACGSETNRLYLYSRFLETPICELPLGGRDPLSGEMVDMEGFASSVSWVNEQELLVGNSLGLISAACIVTE